MRKGFWSNLFGQPRFKFTLSELKQLYEVLETNPVVTDSNRALVVETIRSIAEFILWGDQNEPKIFDHFLENNVMLYLHNILLQPANRSGEVAKQVLQTLSIIIQNVRSEYGIYFLFSNNHVNNIVDLPFDFGDEEVLGYYISFLKTISLKLNGRTVQFFVYNGEDGVEFPLYTSATRFAHHKEGMVRAAVRTLTLNVYSVHEEYIQDFVTSPEARPYFSEVAHYVAEQAMLLDKRMVSAESGGGQALSTLDSQLAEVEDIIAYCSDVMSTGIPLVAHLMAEALWSVLSGPILLLPILDLGLTGQAAPSPRRGESGSGLHRHTRSHSRATSAGSSIAGGLDLSAKVARVRAQCALFIWERIFLSISFPPLLHQALLALLQVTPSSETKVANATSPEGRQGDKRFPEVVGRSTLHVSKSTSADEAPGSPEGSSRRRLSQPPLYASSCRQILLGILTSNQALLILQLLRVLVAILQNKSVSPQLLYFLGLFPPARMDEAKLYNLTQGHALVPMSSVDLLGEMPLDCSAQCDSFWWIGRYYPTHKGPLLAPGISRSGLSTSSPRGPSNLHASPSTEGLELQALTSSSRPDKALDDPYGADVLDCSCPVEEPVDITEDLVNDIATRLQTLGCSDQENSQSQTHVNRKNIVSNEIPLALFSIFEHCSHVPALGLWCLGWLLHQLVPVQPGLSHGHAPTRSQEALSLQQSPAHVRLTLAGQGNSHSPSVSVSEEPFSSGHEVNLSIGLASLGTTPSSSIWGSTAADGGGSPRSISSAGASSISNPPSSTPTRAVLTEDQLNILQAALETTQVALLEELNGMWCEAIFPLIAAEWTQAREGLLHPRLKASAEGLVAGVHTCPINQSFGTASMSSRRLEEGLSQSARSAVRQVHAVQRLVALAQLQELLTVGSITKACPVPSASDQELKEADIHEGMQVELVPGSAIGCVVSFAPGQERKVYFAVAGLSLQKLSSMEKDHSRLANQQALVRATPVAVLAEPARDKLNVGVVLSVAPLLGADPTPDKVVSKWLHVHVRPSVRGLLRLIKGAGSRKGGYMSSVRQLADGHWVLAFQSGDHANNAKNLVEQHIAKLRALYCELLAPLLTVAYRDKPPREGAS